HLQNKRTTQYICALARFHARTGVLANTIRAGSPPPRDARWLSIRRCSAQPPDAASVLVRKRAQMRRRQQTPQENNSPPVRNLSDAASAHAAHQGDAENFARRNSCVLRHEENLSGVRIFHSGSRRETAHIDVISLRQIRTDDHAFPAWDRNSIRHIP